MGSREYGELKSNYGIEIENFFVAFLVKNFAKFSSYYLFSFHHTPLGEIPVVYINVSGMKC